MQKVFVEFTELDEVYGTNVVNEGKVCLDVMRISAIRMARVASKETKGQCIVTMDNGKSYRLKIGYGEMKQFIRDEFGTKESAGESSSFEIPDFVFSYCKEVSR